MSFWALPGPFWALPVPCWALPGAFLPRPGPFWALPGSCWALSVVSMRPIKTYAALEAQPCDQVFKHVLMSRFSQRLAQDQYLSAFERLAKHR